MLLKFFGNSINERHIEQVVQTLKKGGVIIFPTDTIYAMGCDIYSKDGIEKICRIKNVKIEKANFSFLCDDISNITEYTKSFSTETFRLMKRSLPGPFTFILNASNNIPAIFKSNKKTIGIRVPDNIISQSIIKALGNPMMVTSVHDEDEILEYMTDPEEIHERFGEQVDIVIDGGSGLLEPSTVIDCTGPQPIVIREGLGQLD